MAPEDGAEGEPALPIADTALRVAEELGEQWDGDDPATLAIDDSMQFSIFGGCNRYVGNGCSTARTSFSRPTWRVR